MPNEAAAVQLNALAHDLAAAGGEQFTSVAGALVESATQQTLTYAQAYAPRRTGAMARAFGSQVNGLTGSVWNTKRYSTYNEFGTGTRGEFPGSPIVITPKRAKYLRFTTKDGRVVYAKKVVSPGMAPRPFMRPAVERIALPFANNIANAAVVSITQGPNNPETLTNAPATGWH